MTIEAKIIADSIGPKNRRITTMQLKYPRFIHAELMTHRVFSRNASSSRAIPVEKMINSILDDTAMPVHWGKNQPGMQAHEEQNALVYGSCGLLDMVENTVDGVTREEAWFKARDRAIEVARDFHNAGYHKQIVNRILEPFMHISVLVTSTNFDNFYWLRRHPDAQPEIKVLADAMFEVHMASTPANLQYGEWHLPYITDRDRGIVFPTYGGHGNVIENPITIEDLIKISVARCARVSYLTHDGKDPDIEADFNLYERLVGSVPLHASPAEHQAKADLPMWGGWENEHLSGNLDPGWVQFRKTLPGENHTEYVDAA